MKCWQGINHKSFPWLSFKRDKNLHPFISSSEKNYPENQIHSTSRLPFYNTQTNHCLGAELDELNWTRAEHIIVDSLVHRNNKKKKKKKRIGRILFYVFRFLSTFFVASAVVLFYRLFFRLFIIFWMILMTLCRLINGFLLNYI